MFSDVIQGLILTIYLSTDMSTQFSGQIKEKITNNALYKPLRNMTYNALDEYFKKEPKQLKRIIDYIKTNAKVRIKANEVRNSVIKNETTSWDEHTMENFVPANNRGKDEYREIILIEGKTAKGSSRNGRFDNDTQALFALRGVPLNSFDKKLDEVLKNNEFRVLTTLLKCNIGERFDISKLWYKKIIIMTDSDIDGHRITSSLCAFFLRHMPQIIEQGYLYKAIAPLYKLKHKKKQFVMNKQQYVELIEENIRDNIIIINPKTKILYKDKEVQELLLNNRYYLDELRRTANHFAVHPFIIEFVAIHMGDSNFKNQLKKKFSELDIDENNVLSGIYEGKYQILIMDKIFEKRLENLKKYIHNVNNDNMYFIIHEKYGDKVEDKGLMSLGAFLTMSQKFQPKIEIRYKGLGELNAEDLRDTTLNPNNRILIQLTMNDVEKEMEIFKVLHGDESDERKKLMEHFKINIEDLDN
jgi:DNA gyrase subunit B